MVRSPANAPTSMGVESEYLVDEIPSSDSKDHPNPLDRLISRSRAQISVSLSKSENRKTLYMVIAAVVILIVGKFHASIVGI